MFMYLLSEREVTTDQSAVHLDLINVSQTLFLLYLVKTFMLSQLRVLLQKCFQKLLGELVHAFVVIKNLLSEYFYTFKF